MQNNIFSGLFVGQNLVSLKEVDSTNTFLKNILSNSKPVPDGTVIMAEHQFAGRGQRENTWHAEPGKNLTFSILLRPSFLSASQQFYLTCAVSMGIYDALHPLLRDSLKIKWPNDIYYGDNKLGGMLIENILQGTQIKSAIIGIGLNVNQQNFPDNAVNATSVRKILQKDYDLKNILAEICNHIEAYYLHLKAGRLEFVRDTYLNRLYRLNERHQFKSNGQVFEGVIKDVKESGLLLVEQDTGGQLYNLKEIEFVNT
ncbi:biotin--[acetyl-CoA-carboxylase] ligase [Mucilaginibacter terrigena]|uniref:Biotin--[acetyl-CoA-carboxylase] ligase n=1 Tax=Mucilaginibacter terrigena TaxID=2492395 RepID=A0A4Q5LKY5_9SPHI|nr:biotin--[acetyl-CoA-carboxylase] ligase [Mucilaginibacter terrigena]